MNSLNHIFPVGYPNIPTQEDLNFEVRDLLCHSDSPFDIIHYINDIHCPYHRKALALLVPPQWHSMEQDGTPPAIFEDMDGYLRITWLNIDSDIRRIIKKANAEQVELENQTTPQETLNPQPSYTSSASDRSSKGEISNNRSSESEIRTLNSQTMPLIIKGDPQVINHYEGAHYENCTFINGTPTTQSPIADSPITLSPDCLITSLPDNPLPINNRQSPDLDKFRSLLTVPYLNRKRECEAMLELITRDGYNKKDRARMALALYQSGNVALKREHITTFRQWWRICCELLLWDGADTCYRTTELTENELTKQILSYM
jgi:hypothetical protein